MPYPLHYTEANIQIHVPAALATGKEFPVPIHNLPKLSSEKKYPCPNYELG
jgi:predicted PP-loop superfamily ATPase